MDSFEAMLKRADEKLYEAKRAGKDRVITDLIPS
jgi:PleD family two-component response regulator